MTKIIGYRELSEEEIALINEIKAKGLEIDDLVWKVRTSASKDLRWLDIAQTDLQKGFMSLVRAVAQPEGF